MGKLDLSKNNLSVFQPLSPFNIVLFIVLLQSAHFQVEERPILNSLAFVIVFTTKSFSSSLQEIKRKL